MGGLARKYFLLFAKTAERTAIASPWSVVKTPDRFLTNPIESGCEARCMMVEESTTTRKPYEISLMSSVLFVTCLLKLFFLAS